MTFKVPTIPKLCTQSTNTARFRHTLPTTRRGSLNVLNTIGRGSYGHLSLCYKKKKNEPLVLKELIVNDELSEGLFIKEAKVLHSLDHENIVKFDSVCNERKRNLSILLEYVKFDFQPFGQELTLSSLKDFLTNIDIFQCDGFEHLHNFIAKDIATGLAYLHGKDIVHRDLKPDNILVSNQHYNESNVHVHWKSKPVVAKLTDFGESRAPLVQTASLVHTRTTNLYRGSPVYMAPEIFQLDGESVDLESLKQMDLWSYAMVLFNVINPDLKHPNYQMEIDEAKQTIFEKQSPTDILKAIVSEKKMPKHSAKYKCRRNSEWAKLSDVFNRCATFSTRPNAESLATLLTDCSTNERNLFLALLLM